MTVAQTLAETCATARDALARPGDWLTGAQRVSVWAESRAAMSDDLDLARRAALSPAAVPGAHEGTELLSADAVEVVHRLATDPGRLTRTWAMDRIGQLGEETYTELVAVTSIAIVTDRFDRVLGRSDRPLPRPEPGEPMRVRPTDVGDVGAWVAQAIHKTRANVSRALTLVPETQQIWRPLVDAFYSRGAEFLDLHWDRALSRPQVELVAARTTALNECFY